MDVEYRIHHAQQTRMVGVSLLEHLASDGILARCFEQMSLADVPKVRASCTRLHGVPLASYLHRVFERSVAEPRRQRAILEKFCAPKPAWPARGMD